MQITKPTIHHIYPDIQKAYANKVNIDGGLDLGVNITYIIDYQREAFWKLLVEKLPVFYDSFGNFLLENFDKFYDSFLKAIGLQS